MFHQKILYMEWKIYTLTKVGENFLLKGKTLTFGFKKPYDVLLQLEVRTNVLSLVVYTELNEVTMWELFT